MKRKLTGRVAYRFHKQLFRKPVLVLQVEIERISEAADAYEDYPVNSGTHWRDAELRDITELGQIQAGLLMTDKNSLMVSG